jgi:hypothetical protein
VSREIRWLKKGSFYVVGSFDGGGRTFVFVEGGGLVG